MNKPQFHILQLLIVIPVLTMLAGCGNQDTNPNANNAATSQPLVELTPVQQEQKQLAIKAKDKLFATLLGELVKSMGENGAGESISVCKTRAPEIAKSVSDETGVRIGRTSFKLRNDANQPPSWATSFVSDKVEKPIDVELPNNALGVLLPIRLQATCTLCHGAKNQLMPEVIQALKTNYPNDEATGFAEGDIRGYFWIEVPAQASQNSPTSASKNSRTRS